MNNQKFEDAKKLTQDIEKKVDWLNGRLEELPDYIAIVRQYIPKKCQLLDTLIQEMSNGDFSLEQLNVSSRYQNIKDVLQETTQHIQHLQLEDVADTLKTLVDDIDALIKDLEVEKQSYTDFKTKWDDAYTTITQIYDQYKQALIDQNRIENLYLINEDYVDIEEKYKDFDQILRESYDLEEEMKAGNFSYLQMIDKAENLKKAALTHQGDLNSFFAFRDHLYLQEQRAIDELENINIVLLEIKSEIRNKHLPMISESYQDYIDDSYQKADSILNFIRKRPIDLKSLSLQVDAARDVIYKLYDNVHNLIVTAEMVEDAIVFGNRYRSSFLEVNTELTKAELLYRNGEYTKALSTAVDIIEKIKPDSYEMLVNKKSPKAE